jgi:predicted acyl esterase
MRPARPAVAAVAAVLTLLAVLAGPAAARGGARVERAPFGARGSVGEAYVLGATEGDRLLLADRRGRIVARGTADRLGSKIFYDVRPGRGYTVRVRTQGRTLATRPFAVLGRRSNPPRSFFRRERLVAGLNYITMRDGIELAVAVRLPPGKTLADGPFPTVLEYSGYATAAPGDLLGSLGTDDPLAPASGTAVGSLIAPQIGFAAVSVQMRGSGCSGGAFDLFGLPTTYDGYDAIETVAAQPWVKGGKVGLVGISFSGISQLFAAGTRPPHLAAIAPLSVTTDFYSGTGYPGGIPNVGFAARWIQERMDDAQPAPEGGQRYARELINRGDQSCAANQRLRLQTRNMPQLMAENPYRTPAIHAVRSAGTWMGRIDVPTFLVGQFQDEQTGGQFAQSLGLLSRNRRVWLSLQNGVHVDSLGPSTITRWAEFLWLYVGDAIPRIPEPVIALGGALYRVLADAGAAPIQQSRFAGMTDVAAARRIFARDPRVRLLMDNGTGPAGLGSIGATWELGYDAWPIRQARPTRFYLGRGGALTRTRLRAAATAGYVADPSARPAQTLPGNGEGDAWKAQPPYDWRPLAAGKGLGFATGALARDVVIAGSSSLDVHLRSSARDTDLQVTLSEVRPDGRETYVQNGWLRASHRRLDRRRSTALDPVPTHLERDAAPLPRGRWALVRVPIHPVAHAFRAGSRIRVTIQAPSGDRPRWAFASIDQGRTRNTVGLGGARASRLVLPVLAGATAKGTPLPPPTALRGQPSRAYAAASNGS